jgi:outer membrane receptor protein involved in Fe transport
MRSSKVHWSVSALFSIMAGTVSAQEAVGQRGVAESTIAMPPPSVSTTTIASVLSRSITAQCEHVSLKRAIDVVASAARMRVQYRVAVIERVKTPITVHADRTPLGVVLAHMLDETGLQAVVLSDRMFSIEPTSPGAVTDGVIRGRVTEAGTGRPLAGVTILLDDASRGVLTNGDGVYRLAAVRLGQHRITARFIGRVRQSKSVTVGESAVESVDFDLAPSATALNQVVVTGTVVPTELKAVPNAITVITAQQIEQRGVTRIDQLFRGDVPGLFALAFNSDNPYDQVTMFSRGASSLSTTQPSGIKTYVDGVELADPKYLSQINVNSIERIEILTGPQASTIYGSNGVMQVFTKRGASAKPQLTLNLLSGWIENNFTSARTPQHDYNAQLNGVEGRISYNAGIAWEYLGPWTPSRQVAKFNVSGGARFELPTTRGRVTADVSLLRTASNNRQNGSVFQGWAAYQATGYYTGANSLDSPRRHAFNGQTTGATIGYAPTSWWSHDATFGQDVANALSRQLGRGYIAPYDTSLSIRQSISDRRSLRYTTTAQLPIASRVQLGVTAGADGWRLFSTTVVGSAQQLSGTLSSPFVSQFPTHNTGGFVQTQLSLIDRLFLTYGLRAEWNPNYGGDELPNYSPRYGAAYSTELGSVSAKLRASYGRSTRPPARGQKAEVLYRDRYLSTAYAPYFGDFLSILPNPDLSPEVQQGGEGGVELYFGRRASLVITRYNQTVNRLIAMPRVDSIQSFVPNPPLSTDNGNFRDSQGYGYMYQYRYLNLANIRNQGWEAQGSVNVGPFTTKGVYGFTKSRSIGVDPQYRSLLNIRDNALYTPGAMVTLLPEHTWALNVAYSNARNMIAFNVNGISQRPLLSSGSTMFLEHLSSSIRLPQNRYNRSPAGWVDYEKGYAITDMNMSHRFSARFQAVLHVKNLTDQYIDDFHGASPSMGREAKAGLQIRL